MSSEFIYGRRAVAEAERGKRKVHRVVTSDDASDAELERLCGSVEHQGIVAEVEPFGYADSSQLLRHENALVLALDEVQDPHNLGAACRVAEVAGASGVVICERRAAAITPAVVKASAGATEHLEIAHVGNLADWLEMARKQRAWIYGAAGDASQSIYQVDWKGRAVVVMGSESKGLRKRVADNCDALVSIPSSGAVDSLNVSTAAAVILFEAQRQRSA
ncbi:MAG: 23S rRNA (guanosine(2251)-2'-O)-methyltransferase RlmB [bacterium]